MSDRSLVSVLAQLLPYLTLLVPVLVMAIVSAVKRYVVPLLDRLSAREQQAVVGAIAAVITAVLQAYGVALPEGVSALSPEGLQFYLYAALGALGAHAVAKPKRGPGAGGAP